MTRYEDFVSRHWGVAGVKGEKAKGEVVQALLTLYTKALTLAQQVLAADGSRPTFIAAIGLLGEIGEVSEHLKKSVRGGTLDRVALRLELGDALFYANRLALAHTGRLNIAALDAVRAVEALIETLRYSVEEVQLANMEKLEARYGKR